MFFFNAENERSKGELQGQKKALPQRGVKRQKKKEEGEGSGATEKNAWKRITVNAGCNQGPSEGLGA